MYSLYITGYKFTKIMLNKKVEQKDHEKK